MKHLLYKAVLEAPGGDGTYKNEMTYPCKKNDTRL